jgi:hypothetical protein
VAYRFHDIVIKGIGAFRASEPAFAPQRAQFEAAARTDCRPVRRAGSVEAYSDQVVYIELEAALADDYAAAIGTGFT